MTCTQTGSCNNSSGVWTQLLTLPVFANPGLQLSLHSLSFPTNNTTFRISLECDENLTWLRTYSEFCGVCKVLVWFAYCSWEHICGSVWVETKCIFDIYRMYCCPSSSRLNYSHLLKKKKWIQLLFEAFLGNQKWKKNKFWGISVLEINVRGFRVISLFCYYYNDFFFLSLTKIFLKLTALHKAPKP